MVLVECEGAEMDPLLGSGSDRTDSEVHKVGSELVLERNDCEVLTRGRLDHTSASETGT